MIDIHTHVLPCIDDGSNSIDESLKILETMSETGIEKIIATPHYYFASGESIDGFLKKRQESYEKIKDKKPETMDIILGAEVKLEYNIHKQDLRKLAIQGTDYILIEMPYNKWDPWVFDELFKISAKHGLYVVIAHIDRYVGIVKKHDINTLMDMRLKFQVNVDDMGGIFRRSDALKFIKSGVADLVASDCHN
ncbi:MAG: CpsB/CapC family capsule biosynthesis tyrosine phosphatase, partial [Clostridia bacterium]|nr:CpsB/CapC family capsule biosynthesis tyrosine phosphatase [Clostridia bacterium]